LAIHRTHAEYQVELPVEQNWDPSVWVFQTR
jgi:hypothetical protein